MMDGLQGEGLKRSGAASSPSPCREIERRPGGQAGERSRRPVPRSGYSRASSRRQDAQGMPRPIVSFALDVPMLLIGSESGG